MRKIKSGHTRQDNVFFITENGIVISAYSARTLCFQYGTNPEIFNDLSHWVMRDRKAVMRSL